MPKKDGTATKREIREAENYHRIAEMTDRADAIDRRFKSLDFDVHAFVGTLDLKPEVAEAILDQLEKIPAIVATLDVDEGDRFKLRRIRRIIEEGVPS